MPRRREDAASVCQSSFSQVREGAEEQGGLDRVLPSQLVELGARNLGEPADEPDGCRSEVEARQDGQTRQYRALVLAAQRGPQAVADLVERVAREHRRCLLAGRSRRDRIAQPPLRQQQGESVDIGVLRESGRIDPVVFMRALDTVFLVAAGVAVLGFLLALLLPERRLRESVAAGAAREQGSMVHTGDSLDQVSRCLWGALSREDKRAVLTRLAARAGLDLRPASTWLIGRFGETPGADLDVLARRFSVEPALLHGTFADLRDRGLADESRVLTSAGHAALERLVAARRSALGELLADWSPETHGSLADYLRRVARDFAAQAPA